MAEPALGDQTTINGGTLSPRDSICTITISGILAFVGAGNYIVEVAPASADRTNVTGTAALAGTLKKAVGIGGIYTVGTKYTVLNATGARAARFQRFTITRSFGVPSQPQS